jgi:hypothetical protein
VTNLVPALAGVPAAVCIPSVVSVITVAVVPPVVTSLLLHAENGVPAFLASLLLLVPMLVPMH